MKLLILGGTIFLGKHLVETAIARGHEVTLFNRGVHNPDLFPEAEKLRGDRKTDEGLAPLHGRSWDAVIDTCGYLPRDVARSAQLLKDSCGAYCFISTVSVYADWTQVGIEEDAPLATLSDPGVSEVTGETYGGLKVLCEQEAENAFPGRTLIPRPGLIVGPDDISDRFTYWPYRVAEGGDVLTPGSPDTPVQFIDVRDLATWTLSLLEAGKTGLYNATGPERRLTMGEVLQTCVQEGNNDANLIWVPEEFLATQEVKPWVELPLWIPASMGEPGHSALSVSRAVADGLTFRPLSETVRDSLLWAQTSRSADHPWPTLPREREQAILAAWRQNSSPTPL